MGNFLSNPPSPTFHLGAIFQALTQGVSYTRGGLTMGYPLCESLKIYFSIIYNLFYFLPNFRLDRKLLDLIIFSPSSPPTRVIFRYFRNTENDVQFGEKFLGSLRVQRNGVSSSHIYSGLHHKFNEQSTILRDSEVPKNYSSWRRKK